MTFQLENQTEKVLEISLELTLAPPYLVNKNETMLVRYILNFVNLHDKSFSKNMPILSWPERSFAEVYWYRSLLPITP